MNALRVSCITVATITLPCVLVRFFLLPAHITVSCDWFLAPLVKKTLESRPLPKTAWSMSHYINEALGEIPALQSIATRINRYRTIHITAHGHRPWLKINTRYILTHDGFIIPAYFFNTDLIKTLGTINANLDTLKIDDFNPDLFTFLRNLPSEILHEAHITWHNKTYITIEWPNLPGITIIAQCATILTEKIIQVLTTIAHEKITQKKTKKIPAFTDIRFKNQIILCHKKEGAS